MALIALTTVGASACVLVMDADFEKYQAASSDLPTPEAGLDAAAGAAPDAAPDASEDADTGSGGMGGGGTGGGGTGGGGGSGGTAAPTCNDNVQNQGEEGIDCGGPCPPCPVVGFSHFEDFNSFPGWSPDGAYTVAGNCKDDEFVDGWGISNATDSLFSRASGYYASIVTDKLLYVGLVCDDSMFSPQFDTRGATQIAVEFDSSLLTLDATIASVWLVRDGTPEEIWTRMSDGINRHEVINSVPTEGASKVSIFFRYEAMYEFYWKIDNVRIDAN
jgi:hypothetical protein